MKLNKDGIIPEVVVRKSHHLAGVEVIEIPGLGYWSSVESAEEALEKLTRGQCPMTHEVDGELEVGACRICGELEGPVNSGSNTDEKSAG
ncbi:hypothetical protein [Actinomadura sp. 21ATH]|uniref:hypothetical protein n=1 Tax=Actinomadura sp. 21ATH TaxID=1735444 RepID=UPI0035C0AFC4